ncbi:MAG: hypothetical protein RQ833_06295 [Sphingomonadaceae bacterium]|nr:hypothetical protein [Sphingomonadaceae bacterium]
MKLYPALAIAVAGTLGACSNSSAPTLTAAATPAAAPATPVAAPAAQNCIGLRQIRESRVRSDSVIDFVMLDGSILRSTLPNACPQLGFERAFTYATSLSQLCSTDIITVIVQGGGVRRGASCGLGQFVPISPEAAAAPIAAK